MVARSICSLVSPGTELAIYTGAHMGFSLREPPFPLIPHRPGYALVGEVAALGSAVQGLAVGQRVLMEAGHGTMAIVDTRTHAVVPVPAGLSSLHVPLSRMAGIAFTALRLAPPFLPTPNPYRRARQKMLRRWPTRLIIRQHMGNASRGGCRQFALTLVIAQE